MDKRIGVFAIVIAALVVLGALVYTKLEIYPRTAPVFPSREVLANDYYALERWLVNTGHPVRVEKRGTPLRIVSAGERVVVVQASACSWKNAGAVLSPWLERGGFLVISLDDDLYDEELETFLAGFGIQIEDAETAGDVPVPELDHRVSFAVDEAADVCAIPESGGAIRLARVSTGQGALTVTGRLFCMYNYNLDTEANARLAWDLTGARTAADSPGVLFIREKRPRTGLLGKIADRGNALPPVVSALILIIVGFWMVIPVFGLVFHERTTAARPIRERFLAEVRFFKKHGALRYYLEVYLREIPLRSGGIADRADIAAIAEAVQSGRRLRYRDIITSLRRLESIAEKL
jgi:hypothetical protein